MNNTKELSIKKTIRSIENNIEYTKYIFVDFMGNYIETIYLKRKEKSIDKFRNTICISTQVGCAVGCKFCIPGLLGFIRNLSWKEMCLQIELVERSIASLGEKINIDAISLTGIGEPLLNLYNLLPFLDNFNKNINICLSTFGMPLKIEKLAKIESFSSDLFISLHSPFDQERKTLMPMSANFPIKEVLKACVFYAKVKNCKINLCYLLFDNINNDMYHAETLANLVDPDYFTIRLMSSYEETEFCKYNNLTLKKSPYELTLAFKQYLCDRGIDTKIFLNHLDLMTSN